MTAADDSCRKFPRLSELDAVRRILPLLALRPWATCLVTVLGLLNSLVEWVGIAFVIPLLASASNDSRGGPLYDLLLRAFAGLPVNRRVLVATVLILIAIGLKVPLSYYFNVTCLKVTQAITSELRRRVFSQTMRLGPSYFDVHPAADTVALGVSFTDLAGQTIARIVWLVVSLGTIIVSTVMLFLLSFWMTCTLALSMLLISALSRRLTRRVESLTRTHLTACSDLQHRVGESVAGIATIWGFGHERKEEVRHARVCARIEETHHEIRLRSALITPATEGFMLAVLLVLMVLEMRGQLPLALLITFSFILYRLLPQVSVFERDRVALIENSIAVEKVFAYLGPTNKKYIQPGHIDFPGLKNGITLRDITFQYETRGVPALCQVSLTIEKGKLTAIVGPSGAGKSTLVNLLCRFYDTDSGEICVDGLPLPTLETASWRRRLAVVSQDPFLFAETIGGNIRYGRPEATEEEVIAAAKKANAHAFILELPHGYDTLVGDRGVRLSGGQRQRIAIARALLCGAEILIFDEATSDLDGISEGLFRDTMRALRGQHTLIAIAHRLSTIEEADKIVVLQEGRVVEEGPLHALLQTDGLFRSLYCAQRHTPAAAPLT